MIRSANSTEIYPNVYRITLSLPGKKPGPINCYLIIGDRITLIDGGTAKHGPELISSIEKLNINPEDIDQIIITHGHIDHYGGVRTILDRCGGNPPDVMAHKEDAPWIDGTGGITKKQSSMAMKLMGVPFYFRLAIGAMAKVFKKMARFCEVDHLIDDGDELLVGNYRAKVIATPGHSRGSICLWLPAEKVLFSGDTVLPHITPNAFAMIDNGPLPQHLSQEEFYRSLAEIEALKPEIVFPGHGRPIESLEKVLNMYRKGYRDRDGAILEIIKDGEFSVYKIARTLFPELEKGKRKILEIYLAVSEVFTHLQVLEKKGEVSWRIRKGLLLVRKAKRGDA